MKYYKWCIKSFFFFLFLALFLYACKKEDNKLTKTKSEPLAITSTINGGEWSDPATWIEKIVPNDKNDVVISGRVKIKSKVSCLNLMIDNGAILEIDKDAGINILHHLINEGIIINNGTVNLPKNE